MCRLRKLGTAASPGRRRKSPIRNGFARSVGGEAFEGHLRDRSLLPRLGLFADPIDPTISPTISVKTNSGDRVNVNYDYVANVPIAGSGACSAPKRFSLFSAGRGDDG